jgi:hypothetical protein
MRISEMIKRLENIRVSHGDMLLAFGGNHGDLLVDGLTYQEALGPNPEYAVIHPSFFRPSEEARYIAAQAKDQERHSRVFQGRTLITPREPVKASSG